MRIALFCLEASRDDFGRLRFRFVLCICMRAIAPATQRTAVRSRKGAARGRPFSF